MKSYLKCQKIRHLALILLISLGLSKMAISQPLSGETYRLETIEHVLGVEETIHFLLGQSIVKDSSQFAILYQHPQYVDKRARTHDIEKVDHRNLFRETYYESESHEEWLSETLAHLWGIDIFGRGNTHQENSPELIQLGKETIQQTNNIDSAFIKNLNRSYKNKTKISGVELAELSESFKRLEVIADLINRSFHEADLIARFNRNHRDEEYIYEFGSHFDLKNSDPRFWKYKEDLALAINFFENIDLKNTTDRKISPRTVIQKLKDYSETDIFEDPTEVSKLEQYLKNRGLGSQEILDLFAVENMSRSRLTSCQLLF